MELRSPPFWIIPFGSRQIGVADHEIRGLIVFDPKGQRNVPDGKMRVYCARANALFVLFEKHAIKHFRLPRSEKQSWLAVFGYKAFLNPALERPAALDMPRPGRDEEMEYPSFLSFEPDDSDRQWILRELLEDEAALASGDEARMKNFPYSGGS